MAQTTQNFLKFVVCKKKLVKVKKLYKNQPKIPFTGIDFFKIDFVNDLNTI